MSEDAKPTAEAGAPKSVYGEGSRTWVELDGYKICVSNTDWTVSSAVIHGWFEPHIATLLKNTVKPGHSFLDLGGNIGTHTLLAASLVGPSGRVVTIEMSPHNCALIQASLEANHFTHVRLVNCAISDEPGTLKYSLTPGTTNGVVVSESMVPMLNGDWLGHPETIEAKRVDDILGPGYHVDVIKMDIEGSELKAVKGMGGLLRRCKPVIIFEFFPGLLSTVGGQPGERLLEAIQEFGYRCHRVFEDGRVGETPLTPADAIGLIELPHRPFLDLIAIPG